MDKPERIALPLTIAASVIAIWVYLRGGNGSTTLVTQTPSSGGNLASLPAVAPLTETLYYPQSDNEYAGNGIGTNPTYNQAAVQNPLVNVPIAINLQTDPTIGYATLPPALFYNLPPWKNGPMSDFYSANNLPSDGGLNAPSNSDAPAGCGCGASSAPKCGAQRQSNKMLDGSTVCFAPLSYSALQGQVIPNPAVTIAGYSVESQLVNSNPFGAQADQIHTIN